MAKHCYALVDADGSILQTTEPRETAPANIDRCVWQQVPDDHAGIRTQRPPIRATLAGFQDDWTPRSQSF
jgi:hypothetical protein